MKKVTVNGVDHELSPDSPRSRSHVELLQDMVTSINNLETGKSPDGLELTSTDAAVNVITSASNDATTTSSVAAMTFKNTVAHASNDLEYNFTDNTDASLLKIDNEGDVTIAGTVTCAGLTSSGATTTLSSTSANTIVSSTSDANTSNSVAALTLKAGTVLTAGDLILNVTNSTDTSLFKVDAEGDATAAGTITGTDIYGSSVRSATAATLPVYSSVADGANTVIRLAALNDMTNGSAKLLSVGDNAGTSYAEKCYFDYDGAFCKSGGDGLKVDRIDHFNAVGIGLKYAIGTAGSGTGITAVNSGVLAHVVHKVTVTHAALTAAATTETVTLWTVPAKTRVLRVVADVTASFTGGGTTACTIEVGVGGSTDTYLTWFAAHSGAVTKGLVEADLGASLVNSGAGTYAFPAWAGGAIVAKFDSATANVSEFDAGSVTFYIECATYL